MAVVSDIKVPAENAVTSGITEYYTADILSVSDYYPFGFQGQEHDDEVAGPGNSVFFKYRVNDPRTGRFYSIDPLAPEYPHNSPYAFSENSTIAFVELEGLEKVDANMKRMATKDLMKIYATDQGKKYLDNIKQYGSLHIKGSTLGLAGKSGYEPRGNIIYYGDNQTWFVEAAENADFPSFVILGHELKHAYDELYSLNGMIRNKEAERYTQKQRKPVEKSAVRFGNYLRSVFGYEDLREKYNIWPVNYAEGYINPENEEITNFSFKENTSQSPWGYGQTLPRTPGLVEATYWKGSNGEKRTKHWMVGWEGDNGVTNIKTFDNKDDYNKFVDGFKNK